MLIISEDSTATCTRYLPAGSEGSSILKGLAALELIVPEQVRFPPTSIMQTPPDPPARRTVPPNVEEFEAESVANSALLFNASSAGLLSAVASTPREPDAPESPQTPAQQALDLVDPSTLLDADVPFTPTPAEPAVVALTPIVMSTLLESVLLTVSAVVLVPETPGVVIVTPPPDDAGDRTIWSNGPLASLKWIPPPAGRLM